MLRSKRRYVYEALVGEAELTGRDTGIGVPEAEAVGEEPPPPPPDFFCFTADTTCPAAFVTMSTSAFNGSYEKVVWVRP
jgi:hypothetical protein